MINVCLVFKIWNNNGDDSSRSDEYIITNKVEPIDINDENITNQVKPIAIEDLTEAPVTEKIPSTTKKTFLKYSKRQRLDTAVDANQRMVDLCGDKIKEKKRYNDAKLAIMSEKNKIFERIAVAVEKYTSS